MRYYASNLQEIQEKIKRTKDSIQNLNTEYEIFYETVNLAEYLTIAKREKEAIKILEPYLNKQPGQTNTEDLAWLYLNYATANQYDNNRKIAELYFKKAIATTEKEAMENVQHFAYHHYGRFLVEGDNIMLAKEYFIKAINIRKRLKDKRLNNSLKALDSLNILEENNYR